MSEKIFILDKNLLAIETEKQEFPMIERGGPGSGHHGHRGRPGEVGGSLPSEKGHIIDPSIPDDIRAMTFYHATDSESGAKKRMESGSIKVGPTAGGRGYLAPAAGRTYATSDLEYALIYALGANFAGHEMPERLLKDRFGYIFEIDNNSLNDIQPDEDAIGRALWKGDYPWLNRLAEQHLHRNIYQKAFEGEYIYWAKAGKILVKRMSQEQKYQMIRDGASIANLGEMKIKRVWKVDKTKSAQFPDKPVRKDDAEKYKKGRDEQIWELIKLVERGGPGSGHHGHRGRPGEVGGSLPGNQISMFGEIDPGKKKLMEYEGLVVFEQALRKRLKASKYKFSWNGEGGQFLIGEFGEKKVYLSHMHADITGIGKHEGEGRGTRMLAEVLEEAANRNLMTLRINAASDAAQALFNRFERWGILKPTKTFKDIGGVSENTVEWDILVDNPAEVVAEKWVKMENRAFYPDLDEMGNNAYVAQSTIEMDGGDIVAVAKLRRQTIFKRRPYSLEVRYFKRNRSRPMLRSEKLMGEMLAADLEHFMKLNMIERGWIQAPIGRDFWLPSWERFENLRLITRGGEGSGHFGHAGRPGEVGGSLPSGHTDSEANGAIENRADWEARRADFAKRLLDRYGEGEWDTGAWIGPDGKFLAPLEDHQQTAMDLMGWDADLTTHEGMVRSGRATDEVVNTGLIRYNVSETEAFFDIPSIDETTDSQWASMAAVVTRLNRDVAKRFDQRVAADVTITIGASLFRVGGGETYATGREAYEWLGLEDEYDYGVMRGGEGSGHFGHAGRPGEVGGSLPSGQMAGDAEFGSEGSYAYWDDGEALVKIRKRNKDGTVDIEVLSGYDRLSTYRDVDFEDLDEADKDEIDFWTGEGSDYTIDRAIELFGLTDDIGEAGYILPNGEMLDFSGNAEGGTPGRRAIDHRDIGSALLEDEPGGTEGMLYFMDQTKSIRFGGYGNDISIDFAQPPTSSQKDTIEFAALQADEVTYDVTVFDPETNEFRTIHSETISNPTIEDIRQMYRDIRSAYLRDENFIERLWRGFLEFVRRGGPGSGHHGHRGRPGKVGGSLPREAGLTHPVQTQMPGVGGKVGAVLVQDFPITDVVSAKESRRWDVKKNVAFEGLSVEQIQQAKDALRHFYKRTGVKLGGYTITDEWDVFAEKLIRFGGLEKKVSVQALKARLLERYSDSLSGAHFHRGRLIFANNAFPLTTPIGLQSFHHEISHYLIEQWAPRHAVDFSDIQPSNLYRGKLKDYYPDEEINYEYLADLVAAHVIADTPANDAQRFAFRRGGMYRPLNRNENLHREEVMRRILEASMTEVERELSERAADNRIPVLIPIFGGYYEFRMFTESALANARPGTVDLRSLMTNGVPRIISRGGEGSGHFDHEGRPGKVGGSLPSGATASDDIGKAKQRLSKNQIEALEGHAAFGFNEKVEKHFLMGAKDLTREEREGKNYMYFSRFRPLGSWADLPDTAVFSGRMVYSSEPLDPKTIYDLELGAVSDNAQGALWKQIYESKNDPPVGDEHKAWVFVRQEGDDYKGFIVHPSTDPDEGPWRASCFDLRGFSGHSYYKTPEKAIGDEVRRHSWKADPQLFESIAQQESFRIGNARNLLRQKLRAQNVPFQEIMQQVEARYPWPAGTPGVSRAFDEERKADTNYEEMTDEILGLLFGERTAHVAGAMRRISIKRGGPGSGHFGHKGRPGEVGGSLPSGAAGVAPTTPAGAAGLAPKPGAVIDQTIVDLSQSLVDYSIQIEPQITNIIEKIATDHGGEMAGLQFRLKSIESLQRKMMEDIEDKGISAEEAAAGITDSVRYTMLFEPNDFVKKVQDVQKSLEAQGFVKYDNKWRNYFRPGDGYDGYNTVYWNEKTGARFELQFHTPESIKIKQKSHMIYARWREEDDPVKRSQMLAEMSRLWKDYQRPKNWEQLAGAVL